MSFFDSPPTIYVYHAHRGPGVQGIHAAFTREEALALRPDRVPVEYLRLDVTQWLGELAQTRYAQFLVEKIRERQRSCVEAGDEGANMMFGALVEDIEGGCLAPPSLKTVPT